MKKFWNWIAGLSLTFYLLMATALCLFWGSLVVANHYAFFSQLNNTRLWEWLSLNLKEYWPRCIWLICLLLVLTLLAINTLACATKRIFGLFRAQDNSGSGKFFISLIPSLVHLLFLLVLLGHLLTFSFGRVIQIPVTDNSRVKWDKESPGYTVGGIKRKYFPARTRLNEQLKQVSLDLISKDGVKKELSFMHPLYDRGDFIFLDMLRVKKKQIVDKEDCDQSQLFKNRQESKKPRGQIYLRIVSDPGLVILVSGFLLIVLLMLVYYVSRSTSKSVD